MQTEQSNTKQSNSDFLKEMIAAGEMYSAKPEEEKPPHPQADFLKEMIEAGEMYDSSFVTKEPRWGKGTDEEKIASCFHQTGIKSFKKIVNGEMIRTPLHCNLCEKCYTMNTEQIAQKIKGISESVKKDLPDGQWRMKVVDEDTEAKSLKKRIKRNQNGRHIELASEQQGKSDMWIYVEDESGKSEKEMEDAYGKLANPDEIDFDKLYKRTRKRGRKVSTGSAFREPAAPKTKEEKEKVLVPQVIIKDKTRQNETERIFEQVNYIQEAETVQEVIRLFLLQFKYIMKELEQAGIQVAAVKYSYTYMTEEQLLEDWNKNVRKWEWLSTNTSLPKDNDWFMDKDDEDITTRLVFPNKKDSEEVLN